MFQCVIRLTLLVGMQVAAAEEASANSQPANQTAEPITLVPLHCIYDVNKDEHFYSVGRGEFEFLQKRRLLHYRDRGIVGWGSATKQENTVELKRWRDRRDYHYFAVVGNQHGRLIPEPLGIWVWKAPPKLAEFEPPEGAVPIYASSLPNGRDMYFARSKEDLETFDKSYHESRRLRRKDHGIVFYLYPDKESRK